MGVHVFAVESLSSKYMGIICKTICKLLELLHVRTANWRWYILSL